MALLGALAALVVLVVQTRPRPRQVQVAPPPARVHAFTVVTRDLQPVARLGGRLVPWRQAHLAFETTGRVVRRAVAPGARLARGAVLLALDDRAARAALAEAQAQLALERAAVRRDRARLALARERVRLQEKEVRRQAALSGDSLVSATQREAARMRLAELRDQVATLEAAVASGDARLALRQAAVDQARLALEHTRLRMPFDGVVDRVHLEVGDLARAGGVAVDVADDRRLEVHLQARSNVAARLAVGETVSVYHEGTRLAAQVVAIQAVPDPRTWTREVVVRLPEGAGRVGAWVEVTLPLPTLQQVLAVPVTALLRDEGGSWVFRIRRGRLERVRVGTGPRVGRWQVIRTGLRAGMQVVARDVAALGDGQRVEVAPR